MTPHDWQTSQSPAAMIAHLGGVDGPYREALAAWVLACRQENDKVYGSRVWPAGNPRNWIKVWSSCDLYPYELSFRVRCSLLRCLVPLRVECSKCGGGRWCYMEYGRKLTCRTCNGTGTLLAPIDPRWLTSTVVDLAKMIRGGEVVWNGRFVKSYRSDSYGNPRDDGRYLTQEKTPSRFDLMPMLHDALMDSGCDDEAILSHCLDPIHEAECFAIQTILKEAT